MAYMSQDRKKAIAEALKKVVPKPWKYTLRVRHHSTLVMTIREADVDLVGMLGGWQHMTINPYHWKHHMEEKKVPTGVVKVFEGIFAALNGGNHDNSDIMSDYHDVGWYVDVSLGEWDKPFVFNRAALREAA